MATGGRSPITRSTTAASPTTTTTATGCNSCTEGQIIFTQGDGDILIDSSGIFSTDPDSGCLSLIATCTAQENYYAFMQFNYSQGGPVENQNSGRTINAPLACVDGQWVYTSMGISRVVKEVSCNEAEAL
ncbi:unnamed protein product [Caenorhabditis bovis]|uniref:C6 domain-containing protein n=1 Tax=Caenorhabditis bovis TaxID=2654633 RepID=A0A8S1EPB6_9PELO|nr:unnamed protein product [Caenorhabditis bovis]